jgi:hypothetical protein
LASAPGATETPVKPGDDPKAVARDLTGDEPTDAVHAASEGAKEALEALRAAGSSLHDARDALLKQIKKLPLDSQALQGLTGAVTGIESAIRGIDGALKHAAIRLVSAVPAEQRTIEAAENSYVSSVGPPVSRKATEQAGDISKVPEEAELPEAAHHVPLP